VCGQTADWGSQSISSIRQHVAIRQYLVAAPLLLLQPIYRLRGVFLMDRLAATPPSPPSTMTRPTTDSILNLPPTASGSFPTPDRKIFRRTFQRDYFRVQKCQRPPQHPATMKGLKDLGMPDFVHFCSRWRRFVLEYGP